MNDPQADDLEQAVTQPANGARTADPESARSADAEPAQSADAEPAQSADAESAGSADAKSGASSDAKSAGPSDNSSAERQIILQKVSDQSKEIHTILQQMVVQSGADSNHDSDDANNNEPTKSKKSLKEAVKHEAQEIFIIFIYLGIWLSVFATMKCLVLLQYGINEFKNAYVMAWITAITFAKVIVVAQKLPLVEKMKERPLFWACVYKSCFFTLITLAAHRAEERLTHMANDPNNVFPMAGVVAHTISLFGVFLFLFAYRDLDLMLGKGTLRHMFFKSRRP